MQQSDLESVLYVGLAATCQFPAGYRHDTLYESFVLGWRSYSSIVLHLPPAAIATEDLPAENAPCAVALRTDDAIYRFDSLVLECTPTAGVPFVRLSWPVYATRTELPREEALSANWPCVFAAAGCEPLEGNLVELRDDGCRLALPAGAEPALRGVVAVQAGGHRPRLTVPVRVVVWVPDTEKTTAICYFDELDESQQIDLLFCLRALSEQVASPRQQVRAVLLFDRDTATLDDVRNLLHDAGAEFTVVEDVLTLVSAVRQRCAAILLAEYDRSTTDPANICRLLRTRSLHELPVLVFGHDLGELELARLRNAGANVFVGLGSLGDQLVREINVALGRDSSAR